MKEERMGLFSKGKANIIIAKSNFYPGETITGKATLFVDKPTLAKEFSVSFIGERKTTVRRRNAKGEYTTKTETTRIYDFKQQLDSEREYSGIKEYNFVIKIPEDILTGLQLPSADGATGTLLNIAQGMASLMGNAPRYNWYLQATLDIPKSLDVNKKADITLG
jgi:hypothetical protein